MTSTSQSAEGGNDLFLTRCLAFELKAADAVALRLELLSNRESWERLFEAARRRRLMPSLAARLAERRLVPPVPASADSRALAPATIIAAHQAEHVQTRAARTASLVRLVGTLNEAGIEPILVKGARALWLDVEPERTMRDFDLLVPGEEARRANDLLRAHGYAPLPDAVERPNRHHFDLLFRADMPGWVEVHRRAGNPYAEPFLPTAEIARASVVREREGARARVPDPAHHLWHGIVHHHFGHSGFARGTIDIKGLYEFAAGFVAADGDTRDRLFALAARNAAGLATLDLWLAAAMDLFAMPLPPDARVPSDAAAVWGRMRRRVFGESDTVKYPGYVELARLGASSARASRLQPAPKLGVVGAAIAAAVRLAPKIARG